MDLGAEAARLGIEVEYVDGRGRRQIVAPAVLQQIVEALGPAAAQAPAPGRSRRAVRPAFQGPAGRWWALAVQLYGIRSQRNWGHGDFSDLLALVELAAGLGEILASASIPGTPYRMICDRNTGAVQLLACATFSVALRPAIESGSSGLIQEWLDYSRVPLSADPDAAQRLGQRLAAIAATAPDRGQK